MGKHDVAFVCEEGVRCVRDAAGLLQIKDFLLVAAVKRYLRTGIDPEAITLGVLRVFRYTIEKGCGVCMSRLCGQLADGHIEIAPYDSVHDQVFVPVAIGKRGIVSGKRANPCGRATSLSILLSMG